MRYKYNELSLDERKIISETDDYIQYESNMEVSDDYEKTACSITGRDFLTKNVNYVYSKIILRLVEVYDENVSKFIDRYYKRLLKHEIKVMLNYPVSKKELKKKTFTSSYSLENLNKRIREDLMSNDSMSIQDKEFKEALQLYIQGAFYS